MGLLGDANDKMHDMKGQMKSTDMDDKAKAKMEEMRRKHAESQNQSDTNDKMAA